MTGLLLPSSVSVPLTSLTLSPAKLNLSDVNFAVGNSAALKKSLPLRWVLNPATPVLMEAMSMVMSTLPVLPARSNWTVPSFLSKRPRAVEVPKCSTSKVTKVWPGSIA